MLQDVQSSDIEGVNKVKYTENAINVMVARTYKGDWKGLDCKKFN